MYMMYVYIYIYIIHFIHTVVQYGAVIQNEAAVKAKRAKLDIIKDRGASVLWIPWWTHSICIMAHAVRCMAYCETNSCWRNGHNVCMSKIRWCLRYQQDGAITQKKRLSLSRQIFPEFPIGQPSILATVQQPQIASSSSLLQHSYAWVTTVTTIVATIHHPFWWDMWYIYNILPVKAHNNTCLVYTKFNALSYGYKLSFFWGPYRFTWFGALSQHNWTLQSTPILTASHMVTKYSCFCFQPHNRLMLFLYVL